MIHVEITEKKKRGDPIQPIGSLSIFKTPGPDRTDNLQDYDFIYEPADGGAPQYGYFYDVPPSQATAPHLIEGAFKVMLITSRTKNVGSDTEEK